MKIEFLVLFFSLILSTILGFTELPRLLPKLPRLLPKLSRLLPKLSRLFFRSLYFITVRLVQIVGDMLVRPFKWLYDLIESMGELIHDLIHEIRTKKNSQISYEKYMRSNQALLYDYEKYYPYYCAYLSHIGYGSDLGAESITEIFVTFFNDNHTALKSILLKGDTYDDFIITEGSSIVYIERIAYSDDTTLLEQFLLDNQQVPDTTVSISLLISTPGNDSDPHSVSFSVKRKKKSRTSTIRRAA